MHLPHEFPVSKNAPSRPHPNKNPPKGEAFKPLILVNSQLSILNYLTSYRM